MIFNFQIIIFILMFFQIIFQENIPLKYVISYTMDGEMFTEFGETNQLFIN